MTAFLLNDFVLYQMPKSTVLYRERDDMRLIFEEFWQNEIVAVWRPMSAAKKAMRQMERMARGSIAYY